MIQAQSFPYERQIYHNRRSFRAQHLMVWARSRPMHLQKLYSIRAVAQTSGCARLDLAKSRPEPRSPWRKIPAEQRHLFCEAWECGQNPPFARDWSWSEAVQNHVVSTGRFWWGRGADPAWRRNADKIPGLCNRCHARGFCKGKVGSEPILTDAARCTNFRTLRRTPKSVVKLA